MPQNRLQRLIQDWLDAHPGETLADLARRGAIRPSTMYSLARTEQRRQTPHPDTIAALSRALDVSEEEVRAAAGDAAGYGQPPSEDDPLLVELADRARTLPEARRRELLALAKAMMADARAQESGRGTERRRR